MAIKTISTTDSATRKVWEEQFFRETQRKMFFKNFMGDSPTNPIFVKTQLEKGKGDVIYFHEITRLDPNNYVLDGQYDIRSKAQKFDHYSDSVTLHSYDLPAAVKGKGSIDYQRACFNIDTATEKQIQEAGAKLMDRRILAALQDSPTRTFYPGTVSAVSGLATTDLITPEDITKMKYRVLGGDRVSTTDNDPDYEPIKPIMVDGKQYIVLVVPSEVAYDLETNSDFMQAMREAEVRGSENPLFRGSKLIWNGVIVKENDDINISLDGGAGSNVPYANCIVLGQSAAVFAYGERPKITPDEDKLNKILYYDWTGIFGVKKTQFNSKDWGTARLTVACTNISGITS